MVLNWIDLLLVLLILGGVASGWYRGFILGFLDLLRSLGSLVAGVYFYQPVARLLEQLTGWQPIWSQPAAFILLIIATGLIIYALSVALVRRLPRDVHRRRINRLFGTLPGLANGLITAAIIAALLFAIPLSASLNQQTDESLLANRFAEYTEAVETVLVPIFDLAIRETFKKQITVDPESKETVNLPFKVEKTRSRPDLESQMLELVNRERTTAGLTPLAPDPELAEVARRHSIDMFARGYFSHYTPENLSPFDRIKAGGVRYLTAGENLALAPTLNIAHTGLMNSPGHRANILRPQFGRLGIGIVEGGRRGLMVTQNFRN